MVFGIKWSIAPGPRSLLWHPAKSRYCDGKYVFSWYFTAQSVCAHIRLRYRPTGVTRLFPALSSVHGLSTCLGFGLVHPRTEWPKSPSGIPPPSDRALTMNINNLEEFA